MEKEFVPYQEALALKELGFDEPCVAFYEEFKRLSIGFNWLNEGGKNSNLQECTAPLYQQAFRWFRDKYGLSGWVDEGYSTDGRRGVVSVKSENGLKYLKQQKTTQFFNTYEEAELACLKKLIDLTKD